MTPTSQKLKSLEASRDYWQEEIEKLEAIGDEANSQRITGYRAGLERIEAEIEVLESTVEETEPPTVEELAQQKAANTLRKQQIEARAAEIVGAQT